MKHESLKIGILGAGGKMGMRIGANLKTLQNPIVFFENSEVGVDRLKQEGLTPSSIDEIQIVDFLIFAVPDILIGKISEDIVPKMKTGATVILLDPAAAYGKQVALRDGITYTVCHPCHPALFKQQNTDAGYHDHFGGISGIQDIVASKLQGDDNSYKHSLDIVRAMFAPVDRIFEMTVEQMAFLEPTAVEVVCLAAAAVIRDTIDILVDEKGIEREAALSFVLGHVKIELAILLLKTNPLSDAAMVAMRDGIPKIINKDWRKVFEKEELDKVIAKMLAGA